MKLFRYEIYRDSSGKFRFRLLKPDNQIIAVSETYKKKSDILKAISEKGIIEWMTEIVSSDKILNHDFSDGYPDLRLAFENVKQTKDSYLWALKILEKTLRKRFTTNDRDIAQILKNIDSEIKRVSTWIEENIFSIKENI